MADDDAQAFQRYVDSLFESGSVVTRLDALVRAEAYDLPSELVDIVALLPPGRYSRRRICDQLNSAIVGHGWGGVYGTVE